MSEDDIKEKAVIYKKQSSRPLSQYHLSMNAAAQEICIANPGMLLGKRMNLIDAARSKIIQDGFQFVKGKSRSKVAGDDSQTTPKRKKLCADVREERVHDLKEDIRDLKDRIGFKEQRRRAAENVKDYKKCEDLTEQITTLRHQFRELEAEMKKLETKNRQSKWYFKRKTSGTSGSARSGLSDEDTGKPKRKGKNTRRKSFLSSRSSTPMPLSSPSEPSTPIPSPYNSSIDLTDATSVVYQPLSPKSPCVQSSDEILSSHHQPLSPKSPGVQSSDEILSFSHHQPLSP